MRRDGVKVKEFLIFLWKNHLKYLPILSIMVSSQYVLITPAVKYRRFYLPKFPSAALSSVDAAPLRRLLPPCR